MRRLVLDHLWDGQDASGYYEGIYVISAASSFSALANSASKKPSLIHGFLSVGDTGLICAKSSSRCWLTHRHNYTEL